MQYRVSPGEEGKMPSYVDEAAPLMSDELIATLLGLGVDNLQVFKASVEEMRTGKVHLGHKAVNILGLVRCVDADNSDPQSEYPAIDAARARDLPLFRLAEHPGKLAVHRRIKDAIEREGAGATVDFHASRSRQTVSA
jgi:hypothetical protein